MMKLTLRAKHSQILKSTLTKISSQKNPQENPLGWGAASLSVMTK
jgi:hypothetical protein